LVSGATAEPAQPVGVDTHGDDLSRLAGAFAKRMLPLVPS
jgi:hypothetical protein